jgi:hypothetical protein
MRTWKVLGLIALALTWIGLTLWAAMISAVRR